MINKLVTLGIIWWGAHLVIGASITVGQLIVFNILAGRDSLTHIFDNPVFGLLDQNSNIGSSGSDIIYGDDSENLILGFGGNYTLYGRGGNDTLLVDNGSDTLLGAKAMTTSLVKPATTPSTITTQRIAIIPHMRIVWFCRKMFPMRSCGLNEAVTTFRFLSKVLQMS